DVCSSDLREQVAPRPPPGVSPRRAELQLGAGRHVRVRVDLPVGMEERDADLLAPVLEAEDLLDALQRGQLGRTVGPGLHDQLHLVVGEPGERRVVRRGEADHLAPAHTRPDFTQPADILISPEISGEGGEAVLEHHDVVVVRRNLRRPRVRRRAERALVGRRQERPGLPVTGDRDPLLRQRVVAQLRRRRPGVERPLVDRAAVGAVVAVEVDDVPAVGQLGDGSLHAAPSVMINSPALSASSLRASSGSPASLITTSASDSSAMVLMPTVFHLVWSAGTTSRLAAAISSRSVSDSSRFGVVNPARTLMPCTPRKSVSTCRRRIAATATGPTSASEGVRTPPVGTTVRSARGLRWKTSATGIELVITVSSGTPMRWCASCHVVVPADRATAVPGRTSWAARRAITSFSCCCLADLAVKPGSSVEPGPIAVAPPCTFSSSPRSASTSRSRRMVMSETPSSRTRSATRTAP